MNKVWGMEGVSQAEMLLLLALADRSNDDNICWPGQTSLAKKCGTTERTIRRTLKSLESKNLLTITARQGDGAGRKTNIYALTLEPQIVVEEGQPDNMTGGGQPDISGRAIGHLEGGNRAYRPSNTSVNTSEEPSVNNNVSKQVDARLPAKRITKPQSFKDFFTAYPSDRKGGRDQQAWDLAKKLKLTDDDFIAMIIDVNQRKQQDQKWKSGCVHGISRYINEHIWKTPIITKQASIGRQQFKTSAEKTAERLRDSRDPVKAMDF